MSKILKRILAVVTALTCFVFLAGPVQGQTIEELLAQITALQAQLATLQTQLAALQGQPTVSGCKITSFDRNLKQGMSGDDVNCLQIVLNSSADTQLAASGVGSSGNETSYFGPLTKAAVVKFQEKYASEVLASWGLTSGTGYVGQTTRAKLNTLLGEEGITPLPPVTQPTASLAADTPAAATVPTSASKVPVLKVNLQAAGTDVTVTGMTFKRTGVGEYLDWPYLYLYVDDLRVTTYGRSITPDAQEVEFPTLNISIPAGTAKSVTLRADSRTTGGAGDQSAFKLISIAGATFAGLPITGNTMTIGGVGVSTVTVAEGVSISDPVVGSQEATVGSFKLTAGNQDVELKQVILTITGTIARANVTNIKFYYENELLAQTAGVDNYDNASLSLATPYDIPKTLSRTFTVKADLGGRVGENLTVKVQQSGDVLAVDKTLGYGAVVNGTFPVECDQLTLKGSTLSMADQGPLTGKVAKNNQDVVLTKIGLTATRNLEVIKLKVTLTASGNIIDGDDTTLVTDLRIKDADTGATLMTGALTTTPASSDVVEMTGVFNLSANTTRNIAITVDMGNSATLDNATISADLEMVVYGTGTVYVRDVITGDYLADTEVVPAKVSGDTQTIVAVSLDLYLASSPISQTVITGQAGVSAVGLMFSAGGGSDVSIRGVTVKVHVNTATNFAAGSTTSTRDKVLVVKLYDGTTLLSQKTLEEKGTAGTDAYGQAVFDAFTVAIAKNAGKNLVVKLDTASNLTQTFYVAVAAATSTVDARDPQNNAISVGGTGSNVVTLGQTPSRYLTIGTAGTLSLAKNTLQTPVSANLALGDGISGVALLGIDLSATKEDVKVTEIEVERTGTADDQAYTAAYLYDGTTPVKASTFAAGATSTLFKELSVIVPADGKKTLVVKVDLAAVDGTYVTSASTTKVKVATSTIEAVGVSSGLPIDCGGVAAEGVDQYIYLTTVKVALSSDSPVGASVPGTLQDVLHLDFINEGIYDATLNNATFTIAYSPGTSGATTTAEKVFKLYDTAGNVKGTATSSGMTTLINGAVIGFSGLNLTIPAGTTPPNTTKLILKGNTTYVTTGIGSYQSFNIQNTSDVVWNDQYVDVSALHFVAPLTGGTLTYGG